MLLFIIQRTRREILLSKYLAIGLLAFGIFTLLLARVPFFGVSVNGAQRWVSIVGIQFQPSEIVNVGMVLYLAHYFQTAKTTLQEMKRPLLVLFLCCVLILIQPKVAGVMILLFLAFVMITTVQVPVKLTALLFGGLLISLFLIAMLIIFLGNNDLLPHMFMHVYNRIRLVGDPFSDPYNQGFQMIHSYYALFNGGLTGLGLGNSITKKGFFTSSRNRFYFLSFSRRTRLDFWYFCYRLIIRDHLAFIYAICCN